MTLAQNDLPIVRNPICSSATPLLKYEDMISSSFKTATLVVRAIAVFLSPAMVLGSSDLTLKSPILTAIPLDVEFLTFLEINIRNSNEFGEIARRRLNCFLFSNPFVAGSCIRMEGSQLRSRYE